MNEVAEEFANLPERGESNKDLLERIEEKIDRVLGRVEPDEQDMLCLPADATAGLREAFYDLKHIFQVCEQITHNETVFRDIARQKVGRLLEDLAQMSTGTWEYYVEQQPSPQDLFTAWERILDFCSSGSIAIATSLVSPEWWSTPIASRYLDKHRALAHRKVRFIRIFIQGTQYLEKSAAKVLTPKAPLLDVLRDQHARGIEVNLLGKDEWGSWPFRDLFISNVVIDNVEEADNSIKSVHTRGGASPTVVGEQVNPTTVGFEKLLTSTSARFVADAVREIDQYYNRPVLQRKCPFCSLRGRQQRACHWAERGNPGRSWNKSESAGADYGRQFKERGYRLILLIQHCVLAIVRDRCGSGSSKGKSSHDATVRPFISGLGEADVSFLPSTDQFVTVVSSKTATGEHKSEIRLEIDLGNLVKEFQHVDPSDASADAIVRVDWEALARKLDMPVQRAMTLMAVARERGLLRDLTIDYDLQKWVHHSRNKGALLVNVAVEEIDYDNPNLLAHFAAEIMMMRDNMINRDHGDFLDTVIIVPNVHAADEDENLGHDSLRNLEILENCRRALQIMGFGVSLNSYGRAKTLMLGIVAHQQGLVKRAIRPGRESRTQKVQEAVERARAVLQDHGLC